MLPPWLVSPGKVPVKPATVLRRAAEVEARQAATAAGAAAAEAAFALHQSAICITSLHPHHMHLITCISSRAFDVAPDSGTCK